MKASNYISRVSDKLLRILLESTGAVLVEGEPPLRLDEWQMAPVIWDAVKFANESF